MSHTVYSSTLSCLNYLSQIQIYRSKKVRKKPLMTLSVRHEIWQLFDVSLYQSLKFKFKNSFPSLKNENIHRTLNTKFRLSHDVVTCDVDRDVSTASC